MSLESDLFETSNTKVLLLTGAGASKPLVMPLMREFYNMVNRKANQTQKECLRSIFQVHAKGKRREKPDLEALLALTERYRAFHDILFGDEKFGFPVNDEFRKRVEEWKESVAEEKKRAAMEAKGLLKTDVGYPTSASPHTVRHQDNYGAYLE